MQREILIVNQVNGENSNHMQQHKEWTMMCPRLVSPLHPRLSQMLHIQNHENDQWNAPEITIAKKIRDPLDITS